MAYTSTLGLLLPVQGTLDGTWGDALNNSITSLIEDAISATTTLTADSDAVLTTTDGAANEARNAIILCSGARTATRTVIAPAASKIYIVINATTGDQNVQFCGTGPTTGVTIANGTQALVAWNGSDFVLVSSSAALLPAAIGTTVQAYDADTAKYDDTTANFTGTLQNGGSNVVVDTDIGSTVQAYDAGLASIAGLTTDADEMVYLTAADTYATTSLTEAGRALLDDADASAQRTTLGLVIGTDVQAYSANLTSFLEVLALPTADGTAGYVMTTDGAGTLSFTAAAAGDVTTDGTQTLTNKTIDGSSNTLSNVSLTSAVTGTLPVANGGTGATDASAARTALGLAIGTDVQAYDADLTNWAGKTAPTGDAVGTTDTQTLTNKTLQDYTEVVASLATSIDPANGSIQTKTLSANTTFTEALSAGQSVTLMVEGADTYTITWPTLTWVTSAGNAAPTYTAKDVFILWKVNTTLYASYGGSYA